MSKLKRIISIGFTFMIMLCMSIYFVGCTNGTIPNGKYGANNIPASSYTLSNGNEEAYFKIKGDKATLHKENGTIIKFNIIEKDNKIYFECYQYNDSSYPQGFYTCEVSYDKEEKRITIENDTLYP